MIIRNLRCILELSPVNFSKEIQGMQQVSYKDLGKIPYREAWDYQQQLLAQVVETKKQNRERTVQGMSLLPVRHYLLFCEHPPVFTLGRSGSMDNLLLDEAGLQQHGIEFFKINRGGDITYHGPGQIVGYPIFDLDEFFTDAHRYVRMLEEAVIRTLEEYGVETCRIPEYTGVWLPEKGWLPKRKICAIGVHLSRWVTMHGFAFNVNSQLDHFRHIIPCGINDRDKDVTSLAQELGHTMDEHEVKEKLKHHFAGLFGFEFAD